MSRLSFRLTTFLMVCASLALVSTSAHAQKPKVVIVPFVAGDGASETASGKFHSLFVDELKTRSDVLELVAPPATKAAPAPAAAPSSSGSSSKGPNPDAVAAMDAGKKAFDDLRFEDAVTSLRKGIDGMLQDPATADYEGVTDGYVKLAAAAFRMGEEKDAKNALLDLARFAPSYVMPPGFPPVFQREFEKAKKRLEKQPKGSVSIEGPPGSTAYLDGRDLGMVPVLEENVPGGTHYVKVEGAKNDRFGQIIQVVSGVVKVKANYGGSEDRKVIVAKAGGVADPAITASLDAETLNRLTAYTKAANAEYAFVGYVYKTSDSQLTLGSALFSVRKSGFSAMTPVSFDTDVLTANTEAYKLADELTKKLTSFGSLASLPVNLAVRQAKAGTSGGVVKTDKPTNGNDEPDVSGPRNGGTKTVLIPKDKPPEKKDPEVVVVDENPPPGPVVEEKKVIWPWIVVGVVVAAGAGVGIGIGVSEATKPVTGTVTATW
ncbi:MAG: PEGA domain-containing protein [Myxococcaceae bacterium]